MADPKHPERDVPTLLRGAPTPQRRVRDLDNPTAQFPIGAMYQAARRAKDGGSRDRAAIPGAGLLDEDDDATELLDWDEEDTEDNVDLPGSKRRVTVDVRFFALWVAAAGVLGLLAAAAATAAILYR